MSCNSTLEPLLGLGIVIACGLGITIVVADDATGIGAVEDFLLAPLGVGIDNGLIMIF